MDHLQPNLGGTSVHTDLLAHLVEGRLVGAKRHSGQTRPQPQTLNLGSTDHLQPVLVQLGSERLEQRGLARVGRPQQQREAPRLHAAAHVVQDGHRHLAHPDDVHPDEHPLRTHTARKPPHKASDDRPFRVCADTLADAQERRRWL